MDNSAKMIHIFIDKSYEFCVYKVLNILHAFMQKANIQEQYFSLSNRFWQKGYPKDTTVLRYKKGIVAYLKEFEGKYHECDSINCFIKVNNQNASLAFSDIKELDNTLECYSIQFCDLHRTTDSNFNKEFIAFFKEAIGENLITKIN